MGEKVELEVRLNDRAVGPGIRRLAKDLGVSVERAQREVADVQKRDREAKLRRGAEKVAGVGQPASQSARAFRGLVVGQIAGNIAGSLTQLFDPFKTSLEKQEVAVRAGAETAGTLSGFAAGTPAGPGGQIVGAQLGAAAGRVSAEAFLQTDENARNRFVNQRVKQALAGEATARAQAGIEVKPGDLAPLAEAMRAQMTLLFENLKASITATNRGTPDLGDSAVSIVRGRARDSVTGLTKDIKLAAEQLNTGSEG